MKLWQECLVTLTLHLSLPLIFTHFYTYFFCRETIVGVLMLAEERIHPNAGTPLVDVPALG